MLALIARYDGKKIVLPKGMAKAHPGTVIVIFDEAGDSALEKRARMKAQEKPFAQVWDNDEDSVYDSL